MMEIKCTECGYPLKETEVVCPECGCPKGRGDQNNSASTSETTPPNKASMNEAYAPTNNFQKVDWAQYCYECGVIGWEAFKKYILFTGRSSRREFWSFNLVSSIVLFFTGGLGAIICLLPMFGVAIRRMHDIGKCGWWCLVPIASFFLCLRRSDEGVNKYGMPNPAKNML